MDIEFFLQLADDLPMAIVIKDVKKDYEIIFWNKKAEEFTGLKREDVLGKNDFDLFSPFQAKRSRDREMEAFKNPKKNGQAKERLDLPQAYFRKWILNHKLPFYDKQGNPAFVAAIGYDATEQHLTQLKLKLALGTATMGTWDWDLKRNKLLWDENMLALYGLAEPPTPETYLDLVHPDDIPMLKENTEKILQGIDIPQGVFRIYKGPENEIRYIRHACLLEYDEKRNPVALSGINWDVTDAHLQEQELERQRQASLHSSKMASLGEMASYMAHEVNNPLAVICGKATYLLRLLDSHNIDLLKFDEGLKKIETTAMRIAKIVRALKIFSRSAESDPMTYFSLVTVIDETLEICREKFKTSGIEIKLNIDPSVRVMGRPGQLSQVILNLLSNSFDAVEGLKEKWVSLDIALNEKKPKQLKIVVTDSGKGIPPEHFSKLGEPFFTTKSPGKGTGLGLSIVKGIIADHGGKFYYDEKSKNTRFVVELKGI